MPSDADAREAERTRHVWRSYLEGGEAQDEGVHGLIRRVFEHLPSDPRCRICRAPFRGVGSVLARSFGFASTAWQMNPTLCNRCEVYVRKYDVGIELELTLLFADVRGSTELAERLGPAAFHHLIDRFYRTATRVLLDTDALVDKLVGDEVIGLYVPGVAGRDFAARAVDAAQRMLEATGYGSTEAPWIELGAGVHTGVAYVGSVGSDGGVGAVTVLGEAANIAARLASAAGPGEALVSDSTVARAGLGTDDLEARSLELKGVGAPVGVRVVRAGGGAVERGES